MATTEESKGRGMIEKGAGKVKEEVGEATGNRSLETEGRVEGAKGDVRQKGADLQRKLERKD